MTPSATARPTPHGLHDPDQRLRGQAHLVGSDPALARIIEHRDDPWPTRRVDPFERLCGAIVSQQLSVQAARTILDRMRKACGRLEPTAILELRTDSLRRCGLSRAKTAALGDLASRVADGRLRFDGIEELDDDEVTRRLVTVRGIGPWSAHMFLLFGLGRPDVWATADQGLRRSLMQLDGAPGLPDPPTMVARAEAWRPWRGLASVYLWARLDATGDLNGGDDKSAPA